MDPKSESPWKLRLDLLSSRLLLWIAGAGRIGDPTPGAHRYLADRYARWSIYCRSKRDEAAARRLWNKAEFHFRLAGPDFEFDPDNEPLAIAMPIPKRPSFTDVVARQRVPSPPDDAT
jgi:hypothetical protein